MTTQKLQELAKLGAQERLNALQREISEIRTKWPDLEFATPRRRHKRRQQQEEAAPKTARKRHMSRKAREAASQRMTKRWREWRRANDGERKPLVAATP